MPERPSSDSVTADAPRAAAGDTPVDPAAVREAAGELDADASHASDEGAAAPEIEVSADVAAMRRGGGDADREPEAAAADAAEDRPAAAEDAAEPEEEEEEEHDDERADGEACPRQSLAVRVEALLFASDRPLTDRRLAALCGLPAGGAVRVREAIEELDGLLRASGRSFRPRKVAGGWQLVTLPAFGPLMARLHRDRQETRLSPAAMETLAIIAYRQPVVRAELEAIRGVSCGEVLRSLLERRLISIVGRSEELGRPMLYGTTRQFLEVFGLASLEDLPVVEGLERRRPPRPASAGATHDDEADAPGDGAGPAAAADADAEAHAADRSSLEAAPSETADDADDAVRAADAAAPTTDDDDATVPAAGGRAGEGA